MTARVQSLRSNTAGARPASGTRLAGEIFTNWPDKQIGVIDNTQNPVDLIAVRFFSTGANYAIGDFVQQGGNLYRAKSAVSPGAFNSSQWDKLTIATDVLTNNVAKAGDTMTGLLTLSGDPASALQAATKQYADKMLPLAGGTMTGAIVLPSDPVSALQAATKQYADKMLPLAGGTMTGAIVLPADPTIALQAATKQYVDGKAGNFSKISSGSIASGTAQVVIALSGGYTFYKLRIMGLEPVSPGGVRPLMVVSRDGGVTYITSTSSYAYVNNQSNAGQANAANVLVTTSTGDPYSQGFILTSTSQPTTASNASFFDIDIYASDSTHAGLILTHVHYYGNSQYQQNVGMGLGPQGGWTHVKLYYNTVNMAAGSYALYGIN